MTRQQCLPAPRVASLRRIVHPLTGETLDYALVIWFPKPHSFTGEDSVEFQLHGSTAVISSVLKALGVLPGFTPAEPGEFTKRAFQNGKLDLTSVEGLGDLIHAETEAQQKQALRQMEGALAGLYDNWRSKILRCRALLEAYIDFSEEENIEDAVITEVTGNIEWLIKEMEEHLNDNRRGERLRSGLRVAILGKPNVGKSSFLNFMIRRPAAIVSPVPGTTRDVIETTLDISGYPVILCDTAGLHSSEDEIEQEGVRRSLVQADKADLVVLIVEAQELIDDLVKKSFSWDDMLSHHLKVCNILSEGRRPDWFEEGNLVVLANKVDLLSNESEVDLIKQNVPDICHFVSITNVIGLSHVLENLTNVCRKLCDSGSTSNPVLTSARHRTHISSCLHYLLAVMKPDESSGSLLDKEETLSQAAFYLQLASTELKCVTGQITTEEILDHIFSSFCIGK